MPHAPYLPGFFTAAASVLPVKPLAFLLSRLAATVAEGRPGLADRLGTYAGKTIAVTPADLDLVFLVTFQSGQPLSRSSARTNSGAATRVSAARSWR